MPILTSVLDFLFPPRDSERIARTSTLETVGTLLRPTLTKKGFVALFPYRAPLIRALIREARFKDNPLAQQVLADALSEYLKEWEAEMHVYEPHPVVLVPIPLTKKEYRVRGHNHLERILSKSTLASRVDAKLLKKTHETLPQRSLKGSDRAQNLEGAFVSTRPLDPGYTYIVIDDITVTGATLEAASTALKEAGATKIAFLALAH